MAEPQKFENFINGQWKEPQGGKHYPDINPADYSDIVGYFPLSTKNDVDEAIQAAHIAFKSWSHMLPAERAKYLEKFAQLLDQEKELREVRWRPHFLLEKASVLKELPCRATARE